MGTNQLHGELRGLFPGKEYKEFSPKTLSASILRFFISALLLFPASILFPIKQTGPEFQEGGKKEHTGPSIRERIEMRMRTNRNFPCLWIGLERVIITYRFLLKYEVEYFN
jgi:hypothetical protein